MDAAKNFAKATVKTTYSAGAVSIEVSSGQGARFPQAPFNAVWWNATDYPDPSDDPNVEVVRVTARNVDTLTIERAQENTAATAKNTPGKTYKLLAGLTAKLITDIQELVIQEGEGVPDNSLPAALYVDTAADPKKIFVKVAGAFVFFGEISN